MGTKHIETWEEIARFASRPQRSACQPTSLLMPSSQSSPSPSSPTSQSAVTATALARTPTVPHQPFKYPNRVFNWFEIHPRKPDSTQWTRQWINLYIFFRTLHCTNQLFRLPEI